MACGRLWCVIAPGPARKMKKRTERLILRERGRERGRVGLWAGAHDRSQERLLLPAMYDVPESDIRAVVVDAAAVQGKRPLEYRRGGAAAQLAALPDTPVLQRAHPGVLLHVLKRRARCGAAVSASDGPAPRKGSTLRVVRHYVRVAGRCGGTGEQPNTQQMSRAARPRSPPRPRSSGIWCRRSPRIAASNVTTGAARG